MSVPVRTVCSGKVRGEAFDVRMKVRVVQSENSDNLNISLGRVILSETVRRLVSQKEEMQ